MKAKLLIIEDDESIRKNLLILFTSLDYDVHTSISAEAALEDMKKEVPDVIVCDINLPKMSGFELKEILNKRKETFSIPLIFLTARNTYDDLRKGMNLAADDYIFKPFKVEDIIKSVELRLLKNKDLTKHEHNGTLFIKVNSSIRKIVIDNINMILAENQYSRIYQINGKEYLVRRSLNEWEKSLKDKFFRVNRSAIVNLDRIEKIKNSPKGKFLYLEGAEKMIKATRLGFLDKLDKITIS